MWKRPRYVVLKGARQRNLIKRLLSCLGEGAGAFSPRQLHTPGRKSTCSFSVMRDTSFSLIRECLMPQKNLKKSYFRWGCFLASNVSFSLAQACMEHTGSKEFADFIIKLKRNLLAIVEVCRKVQFFWQLLIYF